MQKIRVGVVYGGRSVEHEISILSALQAMAALNTDKYQIIPLYISKAGQWYTGEALLTLANYKNIDDLLARCKKIVISPNSDELKFIVPARGMFSRAEESFVDVILPVIHGAHGEDGALQGLLELMNVPYAGPGILGAAVGMDKIMAKAVLKEAGLPVVPYLAFTSFAWQKQKEELLDRIEKELGYPVIIKPANLGSSIGINKAANRQALEDALDFAATFSRRLLVEVCLVQMREINCSVLGYGDKAIASVCEEPISDSEFLTYQDKYGGGKGKGMSGSQRQIPANLPLETSQKIRALAVEAFVALDESGVSRIDFLLDETDGQIYVNEINTIPGSLSFYLWQPTGKAFDELLDELIELALYKNQQKNNLTYSYEANILAGGTGLKGGIKK